MYQLTLSKEILCTHTLRTSLRKNVDILYGNAILQTKRMMLKPKICRMLYALNAITCAQLRRAPIDYKLCNKIMVSCIACEQTNHGILILRVPQQLS